MPSPTRVKDALQSSSSDECHPRARVGCGRDAIRKDFSFIELNDGSSLKNLQIIARDSLPNYAEVQRLITGASIAVRGELVASQGKGQSVGSYRG